MDFDGAAAASSEAGAAGAARDGGATSHESTRDAGAAAASAGDPVWCEPAVAVINGIAVPVVRAAASEADASSGGAVWLSQASLPAWQPLIAAAERARGTRLLHSVRLRMQKTAHASLHGSRNPL